MNLKTAWRYIEEDNVSAAYGLATDEFLMNASSCDLAVATLRLYTYRDTCTLVGRFQNIHAELDLETCRRENIHFGRRLTGGGAIIMGQHQLGICFATANTFGSATTRELYHILSGPVLKALEKLGIRAALQGKNDLETGGKKIAGLGIYVNPQGAIQFHASLLVDLDIPLMLKVLSVPVQKLGDKAAGKVQERMTTVRREIGQKITTEEVRQLVKNAFEEYFQIRFANEPLTAAEQNSIGKIAADRYQSQEWLFQNTPTPDMAGMGIKKTPAGLLRAYVALKGETIKSALITGDFCENENLFRQIEARLKWSRLDKEKVAQTIRQVFSQFPQTDSGLTPDDILDAVWRAAMGAMKEVRHVKNGACFA